MPTMVIFHLQFQFTYDSNYDSATPMAFGSHFYVTIHCTILLTIPFMIPYSIFIVIFQSHLLLNWNFLLKMGLTSSWQKQENNTHGVTLHLHLKWPSQNQRKKEGEGGEVKQSIGRIHNKIPHPRTQTLIWVLSYLLLNFHFRIVSRIVNRIISRIVSRIVRTQCFAKNFYES